MTGVHNRLPHVVCKVGPCPQKAASAEFVTVIHGDPDLGEERHQIDIALRRQHETKLQADGLTGTTTAYGDQAAERVP